MKEKERCISNKDFHRLIEVENPEDIKNPVLEQLFLMGDNMIAQKVNKTIGDEISVYQVVGITETSILYIPRQYTLIQEYKKNIAKEKK